MHRSTPILCSVVVLLASPFLAAAQPLGTFQWQLQSYCNVLSLVVTQNGSVFTLDGFDDQCGAATRAPVTGSATANPDGTIEFGLTTVATPGGAPVHLAAAVSMTTLGGTWRDSTGASGNFVFTTGVGTGGNPRPSPSGIPGTIKLFPDGGFVAGGALNAGSIPASGLGTRMMWFPGKAAFRAGHLTIPAWDAVNVGLHSVAFGLNTVASGQSSAAFGEETLASGTNSAAFGYNSQATMANAFALGYFTRASGVQSLAQGIRTEASGPYSTAFGSDTRALGISSLAAGAFSIAEGIASVAMGYANYAGATGSVALGSRAIASTSSSGSFVFADQSSTANFASFAANEFVVRAAGGVTLYTNAAASVGAQLPPGSSSWSIVSDVNMKENFRDIDGDDVLSKIGRMPIREWNYKTQDAAIRHVGPTAQDFHAAFGLGESELRISTIDADGIVLRAIQVLEARTRAENEALKAELAELRAQLERLDAKPR